MPHFPLRAETQELIRMREQTDTGIVLSLAEMIALRYQVALTLLTTNVPHLVRKGQILEREYADQLIRLAEYADEAIAVTVETAGKE